MAREDLPADGGKIDWHGEYTEVDPPARLALTMSDVAGSDAFEPVTVDLVEVDGGTEMTLTQTGGHLTKEQYAQTVFGYTASSTTSRSCSPPNPELPANYSVPSDQASISAMRRLAGEIEVHRRDRDQARAIASKSVPSSSW